MAKSARPKEASLSSKDMYETDEYLIAYMASGDQARRRTARLVIGRVRYKVAFGSRKIEASEGRLVETW